MRPTSSLHMTLLRPLALALALSAWACESSPTPPESDNLAAFDQLWQDFDRLYSFFVVKDVDWDAARAVHRPRAAEAESESELWGVMTDMLASLEDGHVSLESARFGRWQYTGWYDQHAENFDLEAVKDGYFGGTLESSSDGRLLFGRLTDRIGYVHIPNFGGSNWSFLDQLGAELGDADALIIDIRHNGGGSDQNGREIARHFADQRRLFRVVRWRNGPRHDDFDPPIEDYVEPGGAHFPGPVALLTNRRVFSSAEGFVLMMRVLPQVVVVGDTTGGGSANPTERTLPNGWRYRVSRWWVQTPEGVSFEGVGLAPDEPVQISPEDQASGRDTILERAMAILQEALAGSS